MHKYEIIIGWSDADQVYIAAVPELPGCVARGDTHESALANAHEAIKLRIETATESRPAVPESRAHEYPLRGRPLRYVEPTEPVWSADVS